MLKLYGENSGAITETSRLRVTAYQNNSEISYNKGRLKTLSIGFQTTLFQLLI